MQKSTAGQADHTLVTPRKGHSHGRPAAPVGVLTPSSFIVQLPVVFWDLERGVKDGVGFLVVVGGSPSGIFWSLIPVMYTAGDGKTFGPLRIVPRYSFWGLFPDATPPLREMLISNEFERRPTEVQSFQFTRCVRDFDHSP